MTDPLDLDVEATVIARLRDQVPDLKLIEGAVELANLFDDDDGFVLPRDLPAAYVVSLGDDAAPNARSRHRQPVREQVAVLVYDGRGSRADEGGMETAMALAPLRRAVIRALAGWSAGDGWSPWDYMRRRALTSGAGVVVYQLEFTADWHLTAP